MLFRKRLKCRRKKELKADISQDRESALGKAYGQFVGGGC